MTQVSRGWVQLAQGLLRVSSDVLASRAAAFPGGVGALLCRLAWAQPQPEGAALPAHRNQALGSRDWFIACVTFGPATVLRAAWAVPARALFGGGGKPQPWGEARRCEAATWGVREACYIKKEGAALTQIPTTGEPHHMKEYGAAVTQTPMTASCRGQGIGAGRGTSYVKEYGAAVSQAHRAATCRGSCRSVN